METDCNFDVELLKSIVTGFLRVGAAEHGVVGFDGYVVEGHSGNGEELLARAIDAAGSGGGTVVVLGDRPLVALHCPRTRASAAIVLRAPWGVEVVARLLPRLLRGGRLRCEACGHDLTFEVYRCPRCGREAPFVLDRCPYCGEPLAVKRCPACGASVTSEGRLYRRRRRFGLF